jgi:hypothetical protein
VRVLRHVDFLDQLRRQTQLRRVGNTGLHETLGEEPLRGRTQQLDRFHRNGCSHGHVCSQGAGLRVHGQFSGGYFESKV